jgi:hypothetical protein
MKKLLPPFLVFLLCAVLSGEELSPTGEQISPTTEERIVEFFETIKRKQPDVLGPDRSLYFDHDIEDVREHPLAFFSYIIRFSFTSDAEKSSLVDPVLISFIDFPEYPYTQREYVEALYAVGLIDDIEAYVEERTGTFVGIMPPNTPKSIMDYYVELDRRFNETTRMFIETVIYRLSDRLAKGLVDAAPYSDEIQARVANRTWSAWNKRYLIHPHSRRSAVMDSIALLSVTDLDSTSRVELLELKEEKRLGLRRDFVEYIKDGYTYTPPEEKAK